MPGCVQSVDQYFHIPSPPEVLIKITSLTGMSVLAAASSNIDTRLPFNMGENFQEEVLSFFVVALIVAIGFVVHYPFPHTQNC